jgi:hypothetical protein
MKIARSFNCGFEIQKPFKPRRGGRKFGTHVPVVPLGLDSILSVSPAAKAAGYFQPPLRGWVDVDLTFASDAVHSSAF